MPHFKHTLVRTTWTRWVMWPLLIASDIHRTPRQIAKYSEETTRRAIFLTNFEMFENVVKHCPSCLKLLFNRSPKLL